MAPGLLLINDVDVDRDTYASAKRLALGFVLVWVLWLVANEMIGFTSLVLGASRQARAHMQPQTKKLSATELESLWTSAHANSAYTGLRCGPAPANWDYVCAYIRKSATGSTAMQFGVNVDATRWVRVSRHVPLGIPIPPPNE